jgi:hypothetical protein
MVNGKTVKCYDKRFLSYEILMWLKRAQATHEFHTYRHFL